MNGANYLFQTINVTSNVCERSLTYIAVIARYGYKSNQCDCEVYKVLAYDLSSASSPCPASFSSRGVVPEDMCL